MAHGYEDYVRDTNPYEAPDHIPQIEHMAAKDLIVFLFLTISLGFCLGVATTVFVLI